VLTLGGVATQVVAAGTSVSDKVWHYPWRSGTFVAISILGRHRPGAGVAWPPLFVATVGLATAAVYPVDRMVHFALLGPAWLLLGWAALREAARRRVAAALWRPVPSATTARAA
jgi:hypothetical protein